MIYKSYYHISILKHRLLKELGKVKIEKILGKRPTKELQLVSYYNAMERMHKRSTMQGHCGEGSMPLPPKSQKRKQLVKEFEDFKQQIQIFEDKNEAAITRIRENYTFKKQELATLQNKTEKMSNSNIYSTSDPQLDFSIDRPNKFTLRNCRPVQISQQKISQGCCQEERILDMIEQSKSMVDSPDNQMREDDEITPQCQRYGFKVKKQSYNDSSKQSQQNKDSLNYVSNGVIQYLPTEQSQDPFTSITFQKELVRYKRENQNLLISLDSMQKRYLNEEIRNKDLTQYIRTRQYGQTQDELPKINNFKKNVMKILQNVFFQMTEEYFHGKFIEVQRHVRRIQNKIKRLGFCIVSLVEQRQQYKSKKTKSLALSTQLPQKEIRLRTCQTGANTDQNMYIKEVNSRQMLRQAKQTSQKLQANIKSLTFDLSHSQMKNQELLLSLNELKSNQNGLFVAQRYENQKLLQDLQDKQNLQSYFYQQTIQELKQNIKDLQTKRSQTDSQTILLEENKKSIERESKLKQLKFSSDYEQLKLNFTKVQEENHKNNEEIDNLQKQVIQLRKKVLQKEVEIFSLNSKMRTLQSDVQYRENKIQGLQQIISKFHIEQNSPQKSPRHSNLTNKNSIIQIHFQQSQQSFEDWSQQHIPVPPQTKQSDTNLSIIKAIDLRKDPSKLQSFEQINIPLRPHQDIEDTFDNAIHDELSRLKKEVEVLTKENHYYMDELEELSKMFYKSEEDKTIEQKKAGQASLLLTSLQRQLKVSKCKQLLTQKSQLGIQNSIKLSQLQSLNYSISLHQEEDKNLLSQDTDLRTKLEQLQNQVQIILYEQQIQKDQNAQTLSNLHLQLQHKDEQLRAYFTEIQNLTYQVNQLTYQRNERKDSLPLFQDWSESNNLKHCKISHIQLKQQGGGGYRESLSFRLSADPSEYLFPTVQNTENIKDLFKQDEALQQKMKQGKSTRKDQINMFQKTTSYIKSLKNIIDEKSAQIKELEIQIKYLKSKDSNILGSLDDKGLARLSQSFQSHHPESFNDSESSHEEGLKKNVKLCRSVKLPSIKKVVSSSRRAQAEKQFLLQQNKILLKEIQILQQELLKSEEEEGSLIKLKDFYKEQLKKQSELFSDKIRVQSALSSELQTQKIELLANIIEQIQTTIIKILFIFEELNHGPASGEEREKKLSKVENSLREILQAIGSESK